MKSRAWTTTGFWLLLGFSAGMIVADIVNQRTIEAATANRYDEYCIATGESNAQDVDVVWLLDYLGARLICISMDRNGGFAGFTELDLYKLFKLDTDARTRPHFMMVTGRFVTREIADLCYIAETTTGQVVVCAVPERFDARLRPLSPPRVLSTFSYLPAKVN